MSPRRTDSTKPPGKLKMGLNHSKKAKKPVSCEPVSPSSSNENGDPMGASKHYENINRPRFPFAPEDVTISMSDTSSSKSSGGFLLSENLSILTPHLIIEQSSRLLKNAESANTPDESENSPNLQSTSGVSSITPSPVDFDSTDDDSVSGESCAGSISESILRSEVSTSGELSNEDSGSDSETSVRPSEIIILKKEENAAESVPNDSSVPPKPPVLTFYIPRESTIPKTSDAKKQSLTPFQRINMKTKSKLLSNIKAGYHISQWKKLEKLWDSIYNLKKVNQWKALKSLDNPVLINLKLVQVKYSFVEVVSKVSDFDSCFALFDVLSAASLSKFESHKTEVFMEVATPRFMKTLLAVVESFHSQRPASHKLKSFIENLVDIYGDIFLQLDSLATDGLAEDLIKVIESCLKSVSTQIQDDFFAEHLNRLLFIVNSRDSLIRGNSCFPYDILREESVEENIIDGPYDNFDHYLSIHYRLLKEDFQNSLREGIVKYLQTLYGKRRRTINHHLTIYPNVTLACQLTKYLVKYKIIFHDSAVIRRLQDSATRAFLSGALLLLTPCVSPSNPQPFKEYYLVRVEDSSPLERELTYIFVSMILGPHNPIESMKVLMVEPRQLFEPYHRVMNVIRSLDTNHFPFIRYIVDIKTDVLPPAYMEPTTKLRLGNSECFLWDDETWPNPENLELNKVQLDGLKLALRSELAIIQGPPGTGKTYLSRKIVEVLLQNKAVWRKSNDGGAGLIMVVCFKNQSLDQLLGGLVKAGKKVLRVGKNSRDEMLDEYNLHTLKSPKFSRIYFQMRGELRVEQKDLMDELSESIEVIQTIEDHQGLIKLDAFSDYLHLSEKNYKYLKNHYEAWLVDIPSRPPNFNRISKILGESENEHLIEGRNLYHVSLQDINNRVASLNSKIDNLERVGVVDYVNDLIDAVAYLLQKLDFMKYKLSELSQPLTCDVHMNMMHVRLTFASPESQPPIESLPLDKRWLLYKSWVDDLYQCHFDKMKSCTSKSRDQHLRFVEIDELVNVKKIAQCDAEVIGMTTTAAAKYYKMMDFLKPKIILVEEAAEVIEAHTVASLSKHCEHLILVGDHKQLRPLTSSYLIGKDAHLDVSMYERLVRNGFPHCTLNTQYRMRPEIASLIAPAVYPDLVNDSSVDELPHVLGVCADLYFVDHNVQEDETIETVSRWNVYEAEFLLALCIYLVRQGYQPDQITVLATYAEQESYFNKEKLNYPELEEVLMATVDSFQGKESDIVLLSLVRSNVEGNIGFLAQRNRINVALSRAKRGLFITGNSRSLLTKGGLWHEVIDVLSKNKAIGSALPLKCQIHGRITHVKTPSALRLLRNGGCSTICRALLACGHNCKHRCHPTDRSHEGIFKCSNVCKKRMSCSHSCILTCHVYNEKIKCFCESCTPKTKCEYKLPCGHTCKSMGHAEDVEHEDKFRCSEICNTALTCGHICCSLCHVEDAAHIKRYKCPIVCEGKLVCGHQCQEKQLNKKHVCSKHKIKCCLSVCATAMPCGHVCRRICHLQDRSHEDVFKCRQCKDPKLTFLSVGASSPELTNAYEENQTLPIKKNQHQKCIHGEEINTCEMVCNYELRCGHHCKEKCHTNDDVHEKLCLEICGARLPCGHLCLYDCHMFSTTQKSPLHELTDHCQTCSKDQSRKSSHEFVSTRENDNCDFVYKCGHSCTDKCRKACEQQCGQLLQCGHFCGKSSLKETSHHGTPCEQQCGFLHKCGHPCEKLCHYSDHSYNHLSSPCETCMGPDKLLLSNEQSSKSSDEVQQTHKKGSRKKNNKCVFEFECGHSCLKNLHHRKDKSHSKPCKAMCGQLLGCGHSCQLSCHFEDPSQHGVPSRCRACMNNEEPHEHVSKTSNENVPEINNIEGFQCIHGLPLTTYCEETCDFAYPCGHRCLKKCRHVENSTHSDHSSSHPSSPCETCIGPDKLLLSNEQSSKSRDDVQQTHKKGSRKENNKCVFEFKCGHSCLKNLLHRKHKSHSKPCKAKCGQLLGCGHSCQLSCHFEDPSQHGVPSRCRACMENEEPHEHVSKTSNENVPEINNVEGFQCIHGLPLTTYCEETCDFAYPCGHLCLKKCRHVENSTHCEPCQMKCNHILACGHRCFSLCNQKPSSPQGIISGSKKSEETMCQVDLHCGHECSACLHTSNEDSEANKIEGRLHERIQELSLNALNTCDFIYPCGHPCPKKFRHVVDPSHTKKCKMMCARPLPCGHPCTVLCHWRKSSPHIIERDCRRCKKMFAYCDNSAVSEEGRPTYPETY